VNSHHILFNQHPKSEYRKPKRIRYLKPDT
jgi:hypothetical protein